MRLSVSQITPMINGHIKVEKIMRLLRLISCLYLLLFLVSCGTNAKPVDSTIIGNAGSKLFAESFGVFNEP